MKKYIGIFAAMLLCALLALSAFAAETVVYVNDGGTGDGSSASAPLGNMTEAISKVANGGKVVIVDTYTCADEYHEPTHMATSPLPAVSMSLPTARTTAGSSRAPVRPPLRTSPLSTAQDRPRWSLHSTSR